ncbi:MAG: flagellar motor switch protein FliM [Cryobacterium sp.]
MTRPIVGTVTVDELTGSGVRAKRATSSTVELYDFRRPSTLAREHSRVLDLAFETFARQWGTQITARVRVMSSVACTSVVMQTYDDYAASLPATTAMILVGIDGLPARGVIQFPTAVALTWVRHMLGGNGPSADLPERKFTQIEQALVCQLIGESLEDLRYSMSDLLTAELHIDALQHNSQFAQAAATGDLMVVAHFTIRIADRTSRATVALPASAVHLSEVNPTQNVGNARELIQAQIASVPVDVALRLDIAQVLTSSILSLAVGDVLPIPHPHHRPLTLTVDGRALARAAVGANGARLACIVIDTEEKPA